MENLLENMIKTANSFTESRKDDGDFDFSLSSLNDIDKFIQVLNNNELEAHELDIWTSFISAYVFETARKIHDGEYEFCEDVHQPILIYKENNSTVKLFVWSKLAGLLSHQETGSMFKHINKYVKEVRAAKVTENYEGLVM